jgi:small subunit ribosomal protein S8
MTMTDPISDFLTRVRNALNARHEVTDIPSSKLKVELARILKEEGYIDNFKVIVDDDSKQGTLRVYLKYGPEDEDVINGLKRVSKPGRRVYVSGKEIPKVMGGYGVNVVSTSHGLLTGKDARRMNVGGEILCEIW